MKKKNKFLISLIQYSPEATIEKSLSKAISFIERAAKNKPDIICLPELFLTEYFCKVEDHKYFDLTDTIPGDTTKMLSKYAKKYNINIICPLFEKEIKGVYYNSLAIINNKGKYSGKYRKIHIPDDPSYYEKFYFRPGNLGFKTFNLNNLNVGTLICWDQWFSDAARATALLGSDIIFYPTAIGFHPSEKKKYGATQLDSWITVQRGHAISNGIYIAACNRVGFEKHPTENTGIEFWGNSFICDPQGKILAKASGDKEEIISAEIDLSLLEKVRQHWPFLRDRRPDEYKIICEK